MFQDTINPKRLRFPSAQHSFSAGAGAKAKQSQNDNQDRQKSDHNFGDLNSQLIEYPMIYPVDGVENDCAAG
ncbi:MAG: hypothetical protein IT309_08150 [Anaerolineales bacterium]|nr:hypothetical protein [Anaerolineales bacterium]